MKSIYASYSDEQREALLANYMIDSWSYSKVSTFARNEKEFERRAIYCEPSGQTASSAAGSAYHKAAESYFLSLRDDGSSLNLTELTKIAYGYIDSIDACDWRLQKTTPSIEECIRKAVSLATNLLQNFVAEIGIYLSEIKAIDGVELRCEEWLCVNGVDIPLPCHAIIDLVITTHEDKVVIIDHKSKAQYTDEKDLALVRGKQAITYALVYESKTGRHVDEVWFFENKYTRNTDGSSQIKCNKILFDEDSRRLYEAMLYEPLRRMIEAVADPDYVFTINDADALTDKAELYRFWVKTMTAEVSDFNIPENKRSLIAKRHKKIKDATLAAVNPRVISNFGKCAASFITYDFEISNMNNSERIEYILRTFGIIVHVAHEIEGYSSNTYLLEASAGTKIGNIIKYKLDIASALNVASVRIGEHLVVYQGKSYVGIEVQKKRDKDLFWSLEYLVGMRLPIGIDNFGNTIVWNLSNPSTPHMLICGATGSGKSVSIISTIEYARAAGVAEIVIMDPKNEFCEYSDIHGISVFHDIEDIERAMEEQVERMNRRVDLGVSTPTLIVFDEFADAVQQAKSGKQLDVYEDQIIGIYASGAPKIKRVVVARKRSLEENMRMILQKGRSLGYHIIAATQRASAKIITGDAKVNFPVQVCFRVPKEIDSKVVIDEAGAEILTGAGDGLIKSPEYLGTVRFQGFFYNK